MPTHTLVMDYCPELLQGFHQARIAVRVHDPAMIIQAAGEISRHNTLAAVIAELDTSLAELTLLAEWRDTPIAFYLPSMGEFHQIAPKVVALRSMNARFFFPADNAENHTACRILSSLGLATGLWFKSPPFVKGDSGGFASDSTAKSPPAPLSESGEVVEPDWVSLCDLMAYSLYGKMRHAPIEPFDYLISNYDPKVRNLWDRIWFDDPESSLHISNEGKIALTRHHLLAGQFLSDQLGDIPCIADNPAYQEHQEAWREFFLKDDGCAFCPAWRVCLGRFDGICAEPETGCRTFFLELMEAAEERKKLQGNKRELWQP